MIILDLALEMERILSSLLNGVGVGNEVGNEVGKIIPIAYSPLSGCSQPILSRNVYEQIKISAQA